MAKGSRRLMRLRKRLWTEAPMAMLQAPLSFRRFNGTLVRVRLHKIDFGSKGVFSEGDLDVPNRAIEELERQLQAASQTMDLFYRKALMFMMPELVSGALEGTQSSLRVAFEEVMMDVLEHLAKDLEKSLGKYCESFHLCLEQNFPAHNGVAPVLRYEPGVQRGRNNYLLYGTHVNSLKWDMPLEFLYLHLQEVRRVVNIWAQLQKTLEKEAARLGL